MTGSGGVTGSGGMTGVSVTAPAGAGPGDELAVHGWDVARALDQPYTAGPEVLAVARSFLEQFASPGAPAVSSLWPAAT